MSPRPGHISPWNEQTEAQLRQLWASGMSGRLIGIAMNLTSNQVIGKAHRLHLPPRAAAVERTYATRASNVQNLTRQTHCRAGAETLPVRQLLMFPEATRIAAPPRAAGECAWPEGDPKREGFKFCCELSLPGKSYCAAHHAVAYRRCG